MSIQLVQSNQLAEVNGETFVNSFYPNGLQKAIPCRSQVVGAYWKIPVTLGNRVVSYNELVATDATKPVPDAFKILRLKDALDANTEYGIVIADADAVTTNSFVDNCNGCCGATPVMATVTIPQPIQESDPQTAIAGVNSFIFAFPQNPNSLLFSIPFPWFNGAGPVSPYAPTGITTAAQFVTWANTNWEEYGTWSSPAANVVKLVSTPSAAIYVLRSGMQVALTPANFCFTLTSFSTPAAINGVGFGAGLPQKFPSFALTNANQATLIQRLKPLMPGATFTITTNHLQIATVQAQPKLYNNASVIATAATGVC